MATLRFIGNAPAVAQIDTLTVGGTIEETDLFLMTINGKTLTVPAASTDATEVASNIASAWNSSSIAEFREVTASADEATVQLQSDTAGEPFIVSVTTTEGDGSAADDQTFTQATTVAAAGPSFWNLPANWDSGTVPADGDDVFLENTAIDVLYGLDQHEVTLDMLSIAASFTGDIGLPDFNGQYREYRDRVLRISATTIVIGAGPGTGSARMRLDTGDEATAISVMSTGSPLDPSVPALNWKGLHADNTLEVLKGSVGVALSAGETAQVTPRVGYITNPSSDSDVRFGSGVVLGDLVQSGGKVEIRSDVDGVEKADGTLTVTDGEVTTLRNFGGTVYYNSAQTLGAATIGARGRLDFSQDLTPKTVGTCQLVAGAVLFDPMGVAMPAFRTLDCSLADVKVTVGFDKTYTPSES